MMRLSELRERLGRPISKLLHEAVGAYYRLLTEKPEVADGCCENPQLHWSGTRENAAIVCASCGFVLADDGQLIDWHDPEQIAWEQELAAETGSISDKAAVKKSNQGDFLIEWRPCRISIKKSPSRKITLSK